MELWIRSQDKTILTKINEDIYVYDNLDKTSTIKIDKWQLGTYATKKRTLEVLDEIQKCLIPRIELLDEKLNGKQVCQIGNIESIIYEMPSE